MFIIPTRNNLRCCLKYFCIQICLCYDNILDNMTDVYQRRRVFTKCSILKQSFRDLNHLIQCLKTSFLGSVPKTVFSAAGGSASSGLASAAGAAAGAAGASAGAGSAGAGVSSSTSSHISQKGTLGSKSTTLLSTLAEGTSLEIT